MAKSFRAAKDGLDNSVSLGDNIDIQNADHGAETPAGPRLIANMKVRRSCTDATSFVFFSAFRRFFFALSANFPRFSMRIFAMDQGIDSHRPERPKGGL